MLAQTEIVIYSGPGVAERSIREVPDTFESLLDAKGYHVSTGGSSYFQEPDWMKKTKILIMPGGADLPYVHSLSGEPSRQIVDFVENGGYYLGFCAGAYFASSYVEFDKGGQLEVLGDRELKFFPGTACGPAYGVGTFDYKTDEGARVVPLEWSTADGAVETLHTYYNGGCYFVDAEKYPGVTVLARYADIPGKPAAIIECQVGSGKAILSGVHPEFSLVSLPVNSSHETEIREFLSAHTDEPGLIMSYILERLAL